jgi:uncharacterized protein YbjT (DUF2867 family)
MEMGQIVFIGATGMLGRPVIREMVAAGMKVRAVARNPEKAKALLPDGVEIVKGDLRDPGSIASAMKGAWGLYLNLQVDQTQKESEWCAERDGLETALSCAKSAGIKRVGYLSSIIKDDSRKDWWVFKVKREAAEKVKNSGIAYTVFCPSCFMENLSELQIQGEKLMNISATKNKNYWIAGRDYGKMVVAAFKSDNAKNQDYWIQGLEALDTNEAAEKFVGSYPKRKLKIQSAPLGVLKVVSYFGDPKMKYMVKIMDSVLHMPEPFKGEKAWKDLGKPTLTIEKFAANA